MGVEGTAPAESGAPKIEPHLLGEDKPRIKLRDPDPPQSTPPEKGSQQTDPASQQTTDNQTEPKPQPNIDEQFQSLMRRSKALHEREASLKATEKELEELRSLKQRLQKRDYGALQEHGLSLEEWSERWLEERGEQSNPVAQKLRETEAALAELREWKASQEKERETEQQRRAREEHERVSANFRKEIDEFLGGSEENKLLAVAGLGHEVYNVIAQHAQRTEAELGTPQILDKAEAAKYVREYYTPRIKEQVKQILGLPDFKDVLSELTKAEGAGAGNEPDDPSQKPPPPEIPGQQARQATSLNSRLTSTAPPRAAKEQLSREEKRAAMKAAMFGG